MKCLFPRLTRVLLCAATTMGLSLGAARLPVFAAGPSSVVPLYPEQTSDQKLANYTLLLARATVALAVATVALVGFSAFQIFFLVKADRTSRITADAARQSAEAALAQSKTAGQQAGVLEKQHEIGRLQFMAQHRPRLKIRHIRIHWPADNTQRQQGIFFLQSDTVTCILSVVNVGGTAATILESSFAIYFCKNELLPPSAPYWGRTNEVISRNVVLEVGQSYSTTVFDTVELDRNNTSPQQFLRDNWKLFFMGQIRYQDPGGRDRFVGFCRRWNTSGRFTIVEDPDYEFED